MPASPSKPYRVGRSKTGLGLFATQPIKKGTKIIRYVGPMLDCKKPKDDAVENKYLFQITKRWTVDGSVRKNTARYINHACKPNAESDVNTKKLKITIRAIKNIAAGDEINYDYGTEYFKEYLKPIGCKCDACEKKRAKKKLALRAETASLREKEKAKAERKALKAGGAKTDKSKTDKPKGKTKAASARPKAVAGKTAKARARKSPSAATRAKSAAGTQAQAA
ncbi:MAG: SET domain-containing protein-lysine N-methyltransferase [Tardiphaga sp.]